MPVEHRPPIAISYRPKEHDYLPVVVAAIRHHLKDWPIALLTEAQHLPPEPWLERMQIQAITDWRHSPKANKIFRLWEHQYVFAKHFDSWIWWHDDMLLLRDVSDPEQEFSAPLIAHRQRKRPNEQLSNWHNWLWETLSFFRCQNIYAPNPVLHIPRLIRRDLMDSIPDNWNRKRLLFEPTYLLWAWHQTDRQPEVARGYRKSVFTGSIPPLESLQNAGFTIFNWGKKIDHAAASREFGTRYPTSFD